MNLIEQLKIQAMYQRQVSGKTEQAAPEIPSKSETPSKSDIAVMKKADIVEWLEAHGVDDPQGSVSDMRDQLRSIMFVD